MEEQPMSSSDVDVLSQTEAEDTDTGTTDAGTTSITGTSNQATTSSDNSGTSPGEDVKDSEVANSQCNGRPSKKRGPCSSSEESGSGSEQCVPDAQNVSIDFTEVSDLDADVRMSNMEEEVVSTPKHRASQTENHHGHRHQSNSESSTGSAILKSLPQLDFSSDWYAHKCFDSYWNHYQHAMSWCKKHFETYNRLCNQQQRQQYQRLANSWQQQSVPIGSHRQNQGLNNGSTMAPPHVFSHPWLPAHFTHPQHHRDTNSETNSVTNSCVSNRSKSKRRRRSRRKKKRAEKSNDGSAAPTQTESEFEMEITQDMIDFFAKSQEHRRLREEEKKVEQEGSEEVEHINVEQVKTSKTKVPTTEAPKERPGMKRTAEMKLLYGKGAAMIHGMETALQMTFDRNTDIKQPKIWPNMPLKIVFG